MTFLPEAEVIRKSLEKEIVGKRFKDITVKAASTVGRHRNRPDFVQRLEGRKITGVSRRGTRLLLDLDDGEALVLSLGPEGTLSRETATADAGPQTQAVFTFTTGGALHVVDPAKEAELYVAAADDLDGHPGGIDPLAGTFTWQAFGHHLLARRQPLATLLRDETFILGLGDVYADEILWSAGLAGGRGSATLSSQEIRRLYRAVFEVLYDAVKQGANADDTETAVDDDSVWGEFAEHINVFGREGEPCPRCRRPIAFAKVGDNAVLTYHCTSCQT